jgi:hypothetical protein
MIKKFDTLRFAMPASTFFTLSFLRENHTETYWKNGCTFKKFFGNFWKFGTIPHINKK